jgi:hypothetical protein
VNPNGHRPRPPADWSALQYTPSGAPVRRCTRCAGAYVDDEPSRVAHVAVFGHSPRPDQYLAEPATTEEPRRDE